MPVCHIGGGPFSHCFSRFSEFRNVFWTEQMISSWCKGATEAIPKSNKTPPVIATALYIQRRHDELK